MSKTTAPTKPAPTPAPTAADRILGERRQLLESLDQVLLETARRDAHPPPELRSLARSVGWTDRDLDRELGRAARVLRVREHAGSASERKAARARAEEAEKKLSEAAPRIRGAIEKLQAELASLEQEASKARRESDAREQAVENLRQLAPRHVRQRADDLRRDFKLSGEGRDLTLSESRLRTIDAVLGIPVGELHGRRQAVDHARTARPEAVSRREERREERNVRTETLNEEQWKTYVAELTEERKTLVADLERLRRMRDEAIAEAEKLLDCYAQ